MGFSIANYRILSRFLLSIVQNHLSLHSDMKPIVILSFFMFMCFGEAFSQNIHFTYDAAGNCIRREQVVRQSQQSQRKAQLSDTWDNIKVSISPNPTNGVFRVEIVGCKSDDRISLCVKNASGQQIFAKSNVTVSSSIDISNSPSGMYFLQIILNDTCDKSWKIIKK